MAGDVRPALDRLMRYPLLRGVRMQLHWHENPQYRFATHPDLAGDPALPPEFCGARRLRPHLRSAGLRRPDGRRRAPRRGISRRRPSSCSTPGCWRISRTQGATAWRRGHGDARRAAERRRKALRPRHVHSPQRPRPHRLGRRRNGRPVRRRPLPLRLQLSDREAVDRTIAALIAAYRAAVASYSAAEQAAMLHDTAARVYRLG